MAKKKKKTTKTATFSGGNMNLSSKWQCEKKMQYMHKPGLPDVPVGEYYAFKTGPTLAAGTSSISYSIPSGAKIKSAKISATKNSPPSGIALLTFNGGSFSGSTSVSITGTSGSLNCTFQFKANGTKKDENSHVSTLTLSNITLTITYEDGEGGENGDIQGKQTGIIGDLKFRVPPQSVCVYDQDEKKLYTFDGVIKIQQQMSLKIEEDPSKKKELYVNNARNEPDKVTLDVMMSDVYGDEDGGQLIVESTSFDVNSAKSIGAGGGNTRSSRAINLLHTLKESRRMLTVVTPQYVYTDMLLQGVTVTQDDSCPYGWQGQITFQEKYEVTQAKDTTSSNGNNTAGETRTPSNWFQHYGRII